MRHLLVPGSASSLEQDVVILYGFMGAFECVLVRQQDGSWKTPSLRKVEAVSDARPSSSIVL